MEAKIGSKVWAKWSGHKVKSEVRWMFQKKVFVTRAEVSEIFLCWHVMYERVWPGKNPG